MVQEMKGFDLAEKRAYIITDIKGINFFYKLNMTTALNIGYGKNVTAYYDKENDNLIHIYMNDGGYCVRKNVVLSEDGTTATLLSQNIIGTYDTYFETPSDVYIVEKDGNLYAFDSSLTIGDGSPSESGSDASDGDNTTEDNTTTEDNSNSSNENESGGTDSEGTENGEQTNDTSGGETSGGTESSGSN